MIFKTKAKVITAHFARADQLPYSRIPTRQKCFPKVTAHFSAVLTAPELGDVSTTRARTLLTNWLRDQMVRQQFDIEMRFSPPTVLDAVARRKYPGKIILEDATPRRRRNRKLMVGRSAGARFVPPGFWRANESAYCLPNINATRSFILAKATGQSAGLVELLSGIPTMLACGESAD